MNTTEIIMSMTSDLGSKPRIRLSLLTCFLTLMSWVFIHSDMRIAYAADGCGGQELTPSLPQDAALGFIHLLNLERRQQQLPPYKASDKLLISSRYHVADMLEDGYYDRRTYDVINGTLTPVEDCDSSSRIQSFYELGSEPDLTTTIIGTADFVSGQELLSLWLDVNSTSVALLSPNHREIGVGLDVAVQGIVTNAVGDFGFTFDVFPLIINNEAISTTQRSVDLYVYGEWDEIRLRNEDGAWSDWVPFTNELTWELSAGSDEKTVAAEMQTSDSTAPYSSASAMADSINYVESSDPEENGVSFAWRSSTVSVEEGQDFSVEIELSSEILVAPNVTILFPEGLTLTGYSANNEFLATEFQEKRIIWHPVLGQEFVNYSTPAVLTLQLNVVSIGDSNDDIVDAFVVEASTLSGEQSAFTIPVTKFANLDLFEIDDECGEASSIRIDGEVQAHTFHDLGDVDWLEFEVVGGETYQIVAEPVGDSPADLVVEAYPSCETAYQVEQSHAFAPDAILNVVARQDGMYKVRLYNDDPATFGDDVTYSVSVTQLREVRTGVVVIIAGRDEPDDDLQVNIHNVTNDVYHLFARSGYPESHIHYVVTDNSPNDDPDVRVDAAATVANVQEIITTNVLNQVDDQKPLTIYMMSHGFGNGFYLDEVNGERLLPEQLDSWLDQLEAERPGLQVNIIIDACYAGSFVSAGLSETSDGDGRVVIASSADDELAWSSPEGSHFSDYFLLGVNQGKTIHGAFRSARNAVSVGAAAQRPWIDDNGDGIHNQAADGELAAGRYLVPPDGAFNAIWAWPPYIESVTVDASGGMATIRATVLADPDGLGVDSVQATLFPPSFTPDSDGDRLLTTDGLPTISLVEGEEGLYTGTLPLAELGMYEVRVDAEGIAPANVDTVLVARPVVETFGNDTAAPLAITVQQINVMPSLSVVGFVLMIVVSLTAGMYVQKLHGAVLDMSRGSTR